ncbi:MAG: hypothetical protein MK086_05775 [Flavobacteriales bacterium]|nr:hypothetical protein [Flavobacteriales bacterium]
MILPKDFIESLPLSKDERKDLVDTILEGNAPVSIRVNPFKARPSVKFEKIAWCNDAFYLSDRPSFTADPAFHAGAYYPQEASSMFLSRVIQSMKRPNGPIAVLDLCAAPGGKSTLLRSILEDGDFLLSNEIVPKRASILFENIQKWGHEHTAISNYSPAQLGESSGVFDLILADVPCSGEGLFRKQTSAIDQWSLKNVQTCVVRQRDILDDIWPSLKEGGILIYSTCTYNLSENEENLIWLKRKYDIEFLEIPLHPNETIIQAFSEEVKGYRFLPHITKGEGFFISAIRKLGSSKKMKSKKTHLKQGRIPNVTDRTVLNTKNEVFLLSDFGHQVLSGLDNHSKVFSPGYRIGEMKREKFIPDHGWFLWRKQSETRKVVLSYHQSISFLKCHDANGNFSGRGKVMVEFDGFNLGHGKEEKARVVSKYPKNYRIRMESVNDYQKIVDSIS